MSPIWEQIGVNHQNCSNNSVLCCSPKHIWILIPSTVSRDKFLLPNYAYFGNRYKKVFTDCFLPRCYSLWRVTILLNKLENWRRSWRVRCISHTAERRRREVIATEKKIIYTKTHCLVAHFIALNTWELFTFITFSKLHIWAPQRRSKIASFFASSCRGNT